MPPLLHHTVYRPDTGAEQGDGAEWVVLVHGAGVTSDIWDRQIEAFARRHPLLVPDLRGHGGSKAREDWPAPYDWEAVSRDVLALMDHHGIAAAHLVGVSMGTIVVRTMAELAPGRVRSMVMAGAVVRLEPLARLLIVLAHALKHFTPYLLLYAINAWVVLPRPSHAPSRRLVIRQARTLGRREFLRWIRLTRGLPARLRRYRRGDPGIPTLYVSGDQDHLFLPGVRDTARAHPAARLHVVASCGHVCTVEAAAAFNRVALEFLAGDAGA